VNVALRAEADGSGLLSVRVDLDRDAAQQIGDLAKEVDARDLLAAGWAVSFSKAGDGRESVSATRKFRSPEEATVALTQLTGAGGPFRNVQLVQSRSALATRTKLQGTLDLTQGLEAFGDAGLLRLTGSPLGTAPGVPRPAADAVAFHVRADLPGSGLPLRWDPRMGESVALDAAATSSNVRGVMAAMGAVASAFGFFVLLGNRLRERRIHSTVTAPS
jgi:hypothetical protein